MCSPEDVRHTAFRIADASGRPHPFKDGLAGYAWLDGFRARHPRLAVRTAQSLSHSRAACASEDKMSDYFAKLGAVYARLNILNKPMQIFNVDETGITIVHKPGKVITEIGRKHVWSVTSAEKGKTHTVLTCASASGLVLPPFMIYPRKRMPETLKEGAVPGTSFHCSSNGWITQELYIEWFRFCLANIPPTRPVLVIQDGHATHTSIELIELARSSDVHLLCLPAHTTHILQPLDVAVFKSLKSHYWKECRKYIAAHPGRVITTEVIASLLGKAWPQSVTPINVMAGFKKSGSYPLNPGAVHDRQLLPSNVFVQPENSDQIPETDSGKSPTFPSCSGGSVSGASATSCAPVFTVQEEERYCRRYEEGYDLPDPAYLAWLAVRHPEITSPPSSTVTHLSGGYHECSSAERESSSDVSDPVSLILSLPEPKPSKKRKPALTSKAVTITVSDVLAEIKAKEEEKAQKEAEKQARKVEQEARKVEREQKKKEREQKKKEREQKKQEREAAKAERQKEAQKRKEAKEAAKEARKAKGRGKGIIEKAMEELTLSEPESTSDAQCPKCGLTFQEDDSNSIWVCCDRCQAWLDFDCTGLSDPDDLPEVYFCGCN